MEDQIIHILLADDHPIVRKGLMLVINNEIDMDVIGEAADGREAVELARRLQPQVIIMDINMPVMGGIEATRIIATDFPEMPIIGLSMCAEKEMGDRMRDAGAIDLVSKSGPVNAIFTAIRKARHQ